MNESIMMTRERTRSTRINSSSCTETKFEKVKSMGRKRRKAPGNDFIALQTAATSQQQQQLPESPERAADATACSITPRPGEVSFPWLQLLLMGKVHHRAAGNGASSSRHLPTIPRGSQALRQMHHHGSSSPLQRTPGNQAAGARIEFLSQIATWAASNQIPSLGAFYGERLASACKTAGIPSPVLNSQCERCESVLLPGVNYWVRSRSKERKKKKTWSKGNAGGEIFATVNAVNTLVHRCSYCKYGNQKLGHNKDVVKTKVAEAAAQAQMKDVARTSPSSRPSAITADPTTPVHRPGLLKPSAEGSLFVPVTPVASETVASETASVLQVDLSAGSSDKKRKRKGWTGLKATSTNPERAGFKRENNRKSQ